jgi:hypothetical protein
MRHAAMTASCSTHQLSANLSMQVCKVCGAELRPEGGGAQGRNAMRPGLSAQGPAPEVRACSHSPHHAAAGTHKLLGAI